MNSPDTKTITIRRLGRATDILSTVSKVAITSFLRGGTMLDITKVATIKPMVRV